MQSTNTRSKTRTWIKRAGAATLAAGTLTAGSVLGGVSVSAQGEPEPTVISAVASLNPVSVEPAEAHHRDRRSFSQIQRDIVCGWFPAIC